jgi:hypothetical protein
VVLPEGFDVMGLLPNFAQVGAIQRSSRKSCPFGAVPFAGLLNSNRQLERDFANTLQHSELNQVLLGYLNSGAALS